MFSVADDCLDSYEFTPRNLGILAGKEADKRLPSCVLDGDFVKRHDISEYSKSVRQQAKERKLERQKTKGKGWFDFLPNEMTDEVKNELLALKYSRDLHPDRFFKSSDYKGLPKYFQIGKVIKERKQLYTTQPAQESLKSFIGTLNQNERSRRYVKKRYKAIKEREKRKMAQIRRGKRRQKSKKKK